MHDYNVRLACGDNATCRVLQACHGLRHSIVTGSSTLTSISDMPPALEKRGEPFERSDDVNSYSPGPGSSRARSMVMSRSERIRPGCMPVLRKLACAEETPMIVEIVPPLKVSPVSYVPGPGTQLELSCTCSRYERALDGTNGLRQTLPPVGPRAEPCGE